MHRNSSEGDIGQADRRALPLNGCIGEEVVEDVFRKVDIDGGGAGLVNRRDKDRVAVEKLEVDGEGVGIVGILVEERVQDGGAVLVRGVEGGVDVIKEFVSAVVMISIHRVMIQKVSVPHGDSVLRCLSNFRPEIKFLRRRVILVVLLGITPMSPSWFDNHDANARYGRTG